MTKIKKLKKINLITIFSFIFSLITILFLVSKIDNFGFKVFDDDYFYMVERETPYEDRQSFQIDYMKIGDKYVDLDKAEISGWKKSEENKSGFPLKIEKYSKGNKIRFKADKSLLFNDLKIKYKTGEGYWITSIYYQDNKSLNLNANYDAGDLEQTIHYASFFSILLQYLLLIFSIVFLTIFVDSCLKKILQAKNGYFNELWSLIKTYKKNIINFVIGSLVFIKISSMVNDYTGFEFLGISMTKKDVYVYIILGFFLALGFKTLFDNKKKINDIFEWSAFIINPFVSFYILEIAYNPDLFNMDIKYVLINCLILLLIQLLVFFIRRRKRSAIKFTLFLALIFGLTNDSLMILRESPLIPAFLRSILVAANVAKDTAIEFNFHVTGSLAIFLICIFLMASVNDEKKVIGKKNYFISLASYTAVLVLTVIGTGSYMHKNQEVGVDLWRPSRTYYIQGASYSFYRIAINQIISPSKTYNKEKVEKTLKEYSEKESTSNPISEKTLNGKKPNIIMIQSESLADYYGLGNLKLNKDPLEYTKSLKENTIHGYTYVSVLGGGTVNTEYEALTSLPLSFFHPGSYPFQMYVKNGHTSLARILDNQGYNSYITHPNVGSNYSRKEVWPNLGFEKMDFIDAYEGAEKVRAYISDKSLYEKVIEKYENKDEKPLFSYLVSMQNHGSYGGDAGNNEIKIEGHEGENQEAEEYLNLVNITDEDFKLLVDYFSSYEEPTIICIFGDHQPWIADYYLDIAYGMNNYDSIEKYKTPLTIWANYDIGEEENVNISINYLSSFLLNEAGRVKPSPYQKYLLKMMKDYPIITCEAIRDKAFNDVSQDKKFIEKNSELDDLVYYGFKYQNEDNKYFDFPAKN